MSSIWNRGLKFSIFGESHGKAIGTVIDCLPVGYCLNLNEIKKFMQRRATFNFNFGVSSRHELDNFEIISGIHNSKTTGSPLCALIYNKDVKSKVYNETKNFLRPGHVDYCAKIRYKGFSNNLGSGHLSGRLTAPLTFVGAVCEQILKKTNIFAAAHIFSIGEIFDYSFLNKNINKNDLIKLKQKKIAVLNKKIVSKIEHEVNKHKKNGDSIGGCVECIILGVKPGVGSPMFDKIENYLADLIFSIPAVKALEFGAGFNVTKMTGFQNNDSFLIKNKKIKTKTNNHGGVLGGISSGMPIIFKVAIKPTPTIKKPQLTVHFKKLIQKKISFNGRHDSCIALRAPAIVEAVSYIAIVSQLINQGKL